MLDNVNYVYPGMQCKENTYAYAYKAGSNITYYLCKTFMEGNPSEEFLTLLEESMHKQDLLAETAMLNDEPVYGREMVKKLAIKCKKEGMSWCTKSVRNSQSILYVIAALVGKYARII